MSIPFGIVYGLLFLVAAVVFTILSIDLGSQLPSTKRWQWSDLNLASKDQHHALSFGAAALVGLALSINDVSTFYVLLGSTVALTVNIGLPAFGRKIRHNAEKRCRPATH